MTEIRNFLTHERIPEVFLEPIRDMRWSQRLYSAIEMGKKTRDDFQPGHSVEDATCRHIQSYLNKLVSSSRGKVAILSTNHGSHLISERTYLFEPNLATHFKFYPDHPAITVSNQEKGCLSVEIATGDRDRAFVRWDDSQDPYSRFAILAYSKEKGWQIIVDFRTKEEGEPAWLINKMFVPRLQERRFVARH